MRRGRSKVRDLIFAFAVVCLGPYLFADATRAGERTMTFAGGCETGARLTIAAAGDLLFHKKLQLQAYQRGSDFTRFFKPLAPLLRSADMLYGNLEGPAAGGVALGGVPARRDPGRRLDGRVYSAHLKSLNFNYHPSVVADLKGVGFDVISTANNHALDRGALGIDRTVDAFERAGLPFTGTRRRGETSRPWSAVTRAKGFAIAWVACTYSANGIPDRNNQLLFCYEQKNQVLGEIAELATRPGIDAVILTPHWGAENKHIPLARQRILAREAVDAGAVAVIGTHPHVLQPWEKREVADGREGLIVYSTGNFISNQRRLMERAGALVLVELVRSGGAGSRARLAAAGFVPTWVVIDNKGHRVTMNTGKGWAAQALGKTLQLLPPGNRVGIEWPAKLAVACPRAGAGREQLAREGRSAGSR